MPNGDVTITSAALAIFTSMLGGVVAALVCLFWLLLKEKDRAFQELKTQYDIRYSDVKSERDRLLSVQAQSDRDTLAILGIIKDGVVGVSQSMATITQAIASMQKVIEQLATRPSRG